MSTILERVLACRPKVHNFKPKKSIRWAQVKENGYRVTVVREMDGSIVCFGKKEDYWQDLKEHIVLSKMFRTIPRGSAFDGELYLPGVHATGVITAIKDRDELLKFSPFAIPFFALADYRDKELPQINFILKELGFVHPTTTVVMETVDPQWWLSEARLLNIEGYVFKNQHYDEWYKLKPQKTVDLVVTGWFEGKGKYWGEMGGVIGSLPDTSGKMQQIARVGGGWNDEERADLTEDDVLGKVIEVEYQEVAAQGRLQFPRFLRFRDDKAAKDCTMDQLESEDA